MSNQTCIYLCDDEEDVRGGLSFLLGQCGYRVKAFAGGRELLAAIEAEPQPLRAVFVLDLHNPPMDGDVLHDHLIVRGYAKRCPVVFLSGHGTISRAVRAVNKGALDFVEKPYTNDALLPLLERAMIEEDEWHRKANRNDFLKSMWISLTPQQRRVALLVEKGYKNREIAELMGLKERTVEEHRARAFEKLGVDTPAQLATTLAAMRAGGIDVDADVEADAKVEAD